MTRTRNGGNEIAAAVALLFCLLIFAFAISLKLTDNLPSVYSRWALIGDVAIVLVSLLLACQRIGNSVWLLGIIHGGFCIWHIFNWGKPCHCFSPQSISSLVSVIATFLIGTGMIVSLVKNFGCQWLGVTAVAMSGAILISNHFPSQRNANNLAIIDPVRSLNQVHPFLKLDEIPLALVRGQWDAYVMDVDCEKCMAVAEGLVGKDGFRDKVSGLRYFVLLRQLDDKDSKWITASLYLTSGDNLALIPSRLIIKDGIVVLANHLI